SLAGVERVLDHRQLAALLPHLHLVPGAHLERGNVDRTAIHREVAVPHELARGAARGSEAETEHDVVETPLEHLEQHLAGDALRLARLGERVAELALQQPVDAASLLLLAQLQAVVRLLGAPALAVLAGRIAAALERALVGEAARALQEQLHPLTPAEPASGIVINRHAILLDAVPLGRAAAVVVDGRDVLDGGDFEPRHLERTDGGLAAGAGTLHPHLHALEAHVDGLAGRGLGGHLRGERRALARALEAGLARARPADHVPVRVGDGDDRVVEARLHVGDTVRPHFAVALLRLLDVSSHSLPSQRRQRRPDRSALLACLHLLAAHGHLLRTLPRAGVRLRALSVHGQAAAVPQSAIGADVHEALDVHGVLAAQRALHLVLALDERAQLAGVLVGERLHTRVGVDARLLQQPLRRGGADAEDVRERDLDALLGREIDACDACHVFFFPLNPWA